MATLSKICHLTHYMVLYTDVPIWWILNESIISQTLSRKLTVLHIYFIAVTKTWIIQMEDSTNFECPPHNTKRSLLWLKWSFILSLVNYFVLDLVIYFFVLYPVLWRACLLEKLDPPLYHETSAFAHRTLNLIYLPVFLWSLYLYCCLITALHLPFPSLSCVIIFLYSAPVIYPDVLVWTPSKRNLQTLWPLLLFFSIIPSLPQLLSFPSPSPHSASSPPSSIFLWLCLSPSSEAWPVYAQQMPAVHVWGVTDHRNKLWQGKVSGTKFSFNLSSSKSSSIPSRPISLHMATRWNNLFRPIIRDINRWGSIMVVQCERLFTRHLC